MFSRIFFVAKREFLESVKGKTFLISLFFAPLMCGGILFFTRNMNKPTDIGKPPVNVAFSDMTGQLVEDVNAAFTEHNSDENNRQINIYHFSPDPNDPQKTIDQQKESLRKNINFAYTVIEPNALDPNAVMLVYTCNLKPSDMDSVEKVKNVFKRVIANKRFEKTNFDRDLLNKLNYVRTEEIDVGSKQGTQKTQSTEDKITKMMTPFFFMYLIFFGIFVNGQQMLTSIIEEKSSRVIEVLLSALSPFELLAGKILGLTCVGLVIVVTWAAGGLAAASYRSISISVSPSLLIYFIIFYVLGYLLISAIMAGLGSICNTLKDAQNLMMPLTILFIIPLVSWFKIVNDPQGTYATVLSFIPPITSMVMVLRLCATSDISFFEIAASLATLLVSVLLVIWISAKVFRTGILMYGKKPSLGEVAKWLRKS